MNILFRDKDNNLHSNDISNIPLNMKVVNVEGKFGVQINQGCILEEKFSSQKEAEEMLTCLNNVSNSLEEELRSNS